jgi:quercetin 2,3-dioxygenase
MANIILYKANTRGHANHGWLNAHHSFSFANYQDPKRMNFGVLRVLNDDIIAPSMGFGTHPHDNMEIITIPLKGALRHRDSMGNEGVIEQFDIQVMSAGTGVRHSEFNANDDKEVNLLQIWLFPNRRNVAPRYDQQTFKPEDRVNQLQTVIAPIDSVEVENGAAMGIHQNAWFSLGSLEAGVEKTYPIRLTSNGVYVFVIEGTVTINRTPLSKRDALGVWDAENLIIKADTDAEILLMDVPMSLN